jgi:hypothetical protein
MLIDRKIVASSESMAELMKAAQAEARYSRSMAKRSQEMAEDMRKDSISMKAVWVLFPRRWSDNLSFIIDCKQIALFTMLFLPGTSFAVSSCKPFVFQCLADDTEAILSMPFFAQQKWMGDATKVWLWIALTVPSTVLAVMIYYFHTRRAIRKAKSVTDGEELVDMDT